jgi:hypothetical protein
MFSPRLKESIADFESIYRTLSFVIPADLQAAMRELGAGYSKRKELLFFGNKNSSRSLLEWNQFSLPKADLCLLQKIVLVSSLA